MDNSILKWYGNVLSMEDKRWHKQILTWSPEGRKRRGIPDMKCDREVKKSDKAEQSNTRRRGRPVNRGKATENQ
jgi:hypothetical protein